MLLYFFFIFAFLWTCKRGASQNPAILTKKDWSQLKMYYSGIETNTAQSREDKIPAEQDTSILPAHSQSQCKI